MKVQIFSDLHVDVCHTKPIAISEDIDALIVAGDTCEGATLAFGRLRHIVPNKIPILMVMGNHEYYRRFVAEELPLARVQAAQFNIHLLENDTAIIDDVRFLGATLWTDYCLFGNVSMPGAMIAARYGMNDHRVIGQTKKPWSRFRPENAQLMHTASKQFLREALATPFAGPTVVVTHHGIHPNSVHPSIRDDILSAAYVSDLSDIIETYHPDLWVHGHVHSSFDYRVGATRIVCNPHGYLDENANFDGRLVVEVPSRR